MRILNRKKPGGVRGRAPSRREGVMRRYLFPLIAGLGGAAVLVALGLWQLQRLEWKEGVLAGIEARIGAAPVAVPPAPDPRADRYLPVRVTGTTGARELHVLVSDKTLGAGFRIVTAFDTDSGRRLLLDRGFVPDEAKEAERRPQALTVTGNLHWPDERDRFTPEDDVAGNWWFARDVARMAEALGTEPVLIVARTTAPPQRAIRPMPVGTAGIPNNHLGYAVQWFGLAAVWLGMTALFIRRKTARAGTERPAA
jgi:surfeit locus 1 family protein